MAEVVTYRDAMKFEFSERGAYQNLTYKPVFRASAIFYAIVTPGTDTIISFMNYWAQKNHNTSVSALLTLRDTEGKKVLRNYFRIQDFVYKFSVAHLSGQTEFSGSIEIELYSAEDLKYAYPAVDVFYRTPLGLSFVHSSQRVFNDVEDMDRGTSLNPWQTGFDVHMDGEYSAFVTLINGPRQVKDSRVDFQVFNSRGETKTYSCALGDLPAYGARMIPFSEIPGLEQFLGPAPGFCKVNFNSFGVFNRVMCGNRKKDNQYLSLTHSFYDCAPHADYFQASETPNGEYLAFFPFSLLPGLETELVFYPIYCKARLLFSLDCFSASGALEKRIENFASFDTVGTQMERIDVRQLLRARGGEAKDGFYCLEVTAEGGEIPTRLNFGLNYKKDQIGCNISTSVWMNKAYSMRKRSFAWGPLWVEPGGQTWISILNITPNKHKTDKAEVTLAVFSQKGEIFKRQLSINHAASADVCLQELLPASLFPDHPEIWWFTLQTPAPSVTCNQLFVSKAGFVGGDHSF